MELENERMTREHDIDKEEQIRKVCKRVLRVLPNEY